MRRLIRQLELWLFGETCPIHKCGYLRHCPECLREKGITVPEWDEVRDALAKASPPQQIE
jgi:hypothetical protein